jgi:hypothetical protein
MIRGPALVLIVPPVMCPAIMPVSPDPPARCDSRTGRIAHDPARNQTDRAANQSAGQSAECAVAKPLLRPHGAGKEQLQSKPDAKQESRQGHAAPESQWVIIPCQGLVND